MGGEGGHRDSSFAPAALARKGVGLFPLLSFQSLPCAGSQLRHVRAGRRTATTKVRWDKESQDDKVPTLQFESIASHRIASHRIASHRIASHRIALHCIRVSCLYDTAPADRRRAKVRLCCEAYA